jgi:small redox-active disulfide protein 2
MAREKYSVINSALCCRCDTGRKPEPDKESEKRKTALGVKVLGSGCAKGRALEEAVKEALFELGMDTTVVRIIDFSRIISYGIMSTPALIVDGKVVSCGKVLKKDDVIGFLQKTGS